MPRRRKSPALPAAAIASTPFRPHDTKPAAAAGHTQNFEPDRPVVPQDNQPLGTQPSTRANRRSRKSTPKAISSLVMCRLEQSVITILQGV